MCGVCGIIGNPQRGNVENMVTALRHRGPDDCGTVEIRGVRLGDVRLGMTRLAIIDLSPNAHQPMCNHEGTIWIVYNGETYNFREEREVLSGKGISFKSESDTEVVLKMYETYGDDFLLRMRGMFALAIFDKRRGIGRERLTLARDHLGIKPLIYTRVGSCFVFASEIKALLASGIVEPAIDPISLRMLLTYGSVYQPRTMLRGVNMLLPAHRLIIESGTERIERYWSLAINRYPEMRAKPYDELVNEVGARLSESVNLQLASDVPLGAFLSGGVDSTFLVGLMTRIAGQRIKTFSVGFEAEGKHIDESGDAECTARFFGSDHHRLVVCGTDVRDQINQIAFSLDQPSVDGVNSYFVSRAARQAVTVAVSGTGGDEIFAGYPWFVEMVHHEMKRKKQKVENLTIANFAKKACNSVLSGLINRSPEKLVSKSSSSDFINRFGRIYQIFGIEGAIKLLSPDIKPSACDRYSLESDLGMIDELPNGTSIERVTAMCLRGYTSNQLLRDIDAVSMAHSLEVRVPYLDVPLIDLSLSLPSSSKVGKSDLQVNPYTACYREMGNKRILIDAGLKLGVLPEGIDQQPKRGFGMPFDIWLKGPLQDVLKDTLSAESIRNRGVFDVKEVEQIERGFFEGGVGWAQPWLLMMTELWFRTVLDNKSDYHVI